MSTPPSLAETAVSLAKIAQQVEELGRDNIHVQMPADLVAAAERLMRALVVNPHHVDTPAVVPVGSVALHQLLEQVIWPAEEVDTSTIRDRLVAAGRPMKPSAISVVLHRAVARGQLERVAPGRYLRPTHPVADGPLRLSTSEEAEDVELASSDDEVVEAAV